MYSFTSVNYRISGIIPRSEEQHVGFGKLTLELWNFFLEIYFFFFFLEKIEIRLFYLSKSKFSFGKIGKYA